MMKVVTPAYVFKFVGGENLLTPACHLKRECHYCHKKSRGGMVCVYSNTSEDDGPTLYVCAPCIVLGCRQSERQWAALKRASKNYSQKMSKKERVNRG
jgi:hypothetical protein